MKNTTKTTETITIPFEKFGETNFDLPPTEYIAQIGYDTQRREAMVEYIVGLNGNLSHENVTVETTSDKWGKDIVLLTDFEKDDLDHLVFALKGYNKLKPSEEILAFVAFIAENAKTKLGDTTTDYVGVPTKKGEEEYFFIAKNFYKKKGIQKNDLITLPEGLHHRVAVRSQVPPVPDWSGALCLV